MAVDNAVHYVDSDGDTLRVNVLSSKVVFTTVAKNAHVDDGLGVALSKRDVKALVRFLSTVEGE